MPYPCHIHAISTQELISERLLMSQHPCPRAASPSLDPCLTQTKTEGLVYDHYMTNSHDQHEMGCGATSSQMFTSQRLHPCWHTLTTPSSKEFTEGNEICRRNSLKMSEITICFVGEKTQSSTLPFLLSFVKCSFPSFWSLIAQEL